MWSAFSTLFIGLVLYMLVYLQNEIAQQKSLVMQ